MIREKIKASLDERSWTIQKLHEESGVRYATISEYLNGGKEISSKNLEIILQSLGLAVLGIKNCGSALTDYKRLVANFDGEILTHKGGEITEENLLLSTDEIAAYFLGVLVSTAAEHLQKEVQGYTLNYGDIYERFVAKKQVNGQMVIDFSLSLQKREFVRIADYYFTEKAKRVISILLLWEYGNEGKRQFLESNFLAGLMSEKVRFS